MTLSAPVEVPVDLPDEQQAELRRPYLEVTWTDPVTKRAGFLVIDRLVRGVASGGLRMRAGCTVEEVRGLAAGMTLKEGLHYDPDARYIPLGGAKGGIDCSPYDPRARDVLRRYLEAIRPLLEQHWTTGEDLGVRQQTIDEVVAEIGLRSSIQAVYPLLDDESAAIERLAKAFAIDVDGVSLDELVGGVGVAEAALAGLDELGLEQAGARVFVQGFGSMGGATARFLAQAGLRIVGIADVHGVVTNPAGLDVERLLLTRDVYGAVDRTQLGPGDVQLPSEDWLAVETDVLIPAAVSYCIDGDNAGQVSARLVVEAANMPVTTAGEDALARRGVTVIPDFVANSATNVWWWWTLFGDVEAEAEAAFAKIRTAMRRLVPAMLRRARAQGSTPRVAALAMTNENLAAIDARFADVENP
jgi:glutamate dehydrogenase (NAD(P)+)